MRSNYRIVNLLTTSGKKDIRVSGGEVTVTGLKKIRKRDLINAEHYFAQEEVAKVAIIGGTNDPTIQAGATYKIIIRDRRRPDAAQGTKFVFKYVAPDTLSGVAATDRQNAYNSLAGDINSNSNIKVSANAGSGGTDMTITDDGGYYLNGNKGKSDIYLAKDDDGNGFIHADHFEVATKAVYPFGQGADLIERAPVIDPVTGNVTDFDQRLDEDALNDAVSGQDYDGFYFSSLVRANAHTAINGEVYIIQEQLVFVDEGTGSDTTNLAGYHEFRREFDRIQYGMFEDDDNSYVDLFDEIPVLRDSTGAADPGNANANENILMTQEGTYSYYLVGGLSTNPFAYDNDGINFTRGTSTSLEGVELSAPLETGSAKEALGRREPASVLVDLKVTTVSNGFFEMGLRKKEAYQSDVDNYDEAAGLRTTAANNININSFGILNNAPTQNDNTTENIVDATRIVLEVYVDGDGYAFARINGNKYEINSAPGTQMRFDEDEVLIPFFRWFNDGGSNADAKVRELVFHGGVENQISY